MAGTFIKRLCDQTGITNGALATKARLNRGQVTKIWNGEHGLSVKTAEKLGEALGVDPMLLIARGQDLQRAMRSTERELAQLEAPGPPSA